MFHLRLKKGLSYHGVVSASRKAPDVFAKNEAEYNAALESGYFEAIQDAPAAGAPSADPPPKAEQTNPPPQPQAEQTDIGKMTEKQLRKYADENGISLTGCSSKGEVLQKIKEHEADVAAAAAITGQAE